MSGAEMCSRSLPREQRRPYRPWTADDDATVGRMAGAGYTDAQIAAHLGRDVKLIGRKRRECGVERGVPAALAGRVSRLSTRRAAGSR